MCATRWPPCVARRQYLRRQYFDFLALIPIIEILNQYYLESQNISWFILFAFLAIRCMLTLSKVP